MVTNRKIFKVEEIKKIHMTPSTNGPDPARPHLERSYSGPCLYVSCWSLNLPVPELTDAKQACSFLLCERNGPVRATDRQS